MSTSKEAVIFTQHRYASEPILRTLKLVVPLRYAYAIDALARDITFGSIPHEGARIIASELKERGYGIHLEPLYNPSFDEKAKTADLILISAMDIGLDQTTDIISALGPRKNLMVGGVGIGPVISQMSRDFPWVTFIPGEAETLVGQAAVDFEKRGYMETTYRRSNPFDLSDLARHPAGDLRFSCRDLPMFKSTPLRITEASRGCKEGCEICPTALQPITVKPLQDIEKEIVQMQFHLGNVLFFADQNLMSCPKDYLHNLFDMLNKKKIPWIGEGTIYQVLDDELLLRKIAQNCLSFLVGVEDLFHPIKGSPTKNSQQTDFDMEAKRLRKLKVPVIYSLIFGLDHQDPDIFNLTADKVNRLGLTVAAHLATPRPGTPFWNKVIREERLVDTASIHRDMRVNVVFDPLHMTREELLRGFGGFQKQVYSPVQVAKRFAKNLAECGPGYALGLAITDSVYMLGTPKYLRRHQDLFQDTLAH